MYIITKREQDMNVFSKKKENISKTLLPESQTWRGFLCATQGGKQHRHTGGSGRNPLIQPVEGRTILQPVTTQL